MQSATATPNYTDFNGLQSLRSSARTDPRETLGKVAKQFEGLFIQMMLKSMRDASMGDPMFDSDQSKLYRDMFDKQIALDMSNAKGIGLAEAMVRQLGGNLPDKKPAAENPDGNKLPHHISSLRVQQARPVASLHQHELNELKTLAEVSPFDSHEGFTRTLMPYAKQAADELGVSPLVLIAQAALETGWGKSVIRHPNGESSHNLFNIKAGTNWDGQRVIKNSLEYKNGLASYERSSFRAYDSYADSFSDYVDFLKSSDRYDNALHPGTSDSAFIRNLQAAGYATDPHYADKVVNVMQREVIQNHNLDEDSLDGIV